MSITFDGQSKIFKIDTVNSSYIFCVSDYEVIEHLYYGARIEDADIKPISNRQIYSFAEHENAEDRSFVLSTVLLEYSMFSNGDIRTPSLVLDGGNVSKRLRYLSHEIYKGKRPLRTMPSSRENENTETLVVSLINDDKTIQVRLYYSVYEEEDVIARHAEIENLSNIPISIKKASSLCLDFYESDFSLVTLEGMYLCERSKVNVRKLSKGLQGNFSRCGTTSHHTNPFFALLKGGADEAQGEVYGFNLIYSSNFSNEIEVDRLGNTRIVTGIYSCGFDWTLNCGEVFETPEAVMTYSGEGMGKMSRNFHDHIRNNIIEKRFKTEPRPIVINTWEGAYFDVNEEFLMCLARKGKECGIDTVVLDDGWFRNDISHGLGDWRTVKGKFKSLKELSEKIHELGLKFGIWIEPEMAAMESDFYKNNPFMICSTEKKPLVGRKQYFIDLTIDSNIDYVVNRIKEELYGVEIEYIKWDCNRYLTDAGSTVTPEGEIYHRQMLGVYKMFFKIRESFPDAMIENCSGGGGRFDLGMLYFSPQIWTSDNTDPFARVYIQYGTSLAYPPSAISCHFTEGVCTSGRPSSPDFRYTVASFGPFGFELDLNKYPEDELARFNRYSELYRKREKFVLNSDLYRVMSSESDTFCAYMQVIKDKSEALLTFIEINTTGHTESMILHLPGLDPNRLYRNEETKQVLSGKAWEKVGVRMGDLFHREYGKGGSARQIIFTAL
jgi:alpha-galactosidase